MGLKDITNKIIQAEEKAFVDFTYAENNQKEGLAPVEKHHKHLEDVNVSATMYQADVKDDLRARAARIARARRSAKNSAVIECVGTALYRTN